MPKYKRTYKAVNPDAPIEAIRDAMHNRGYIVTSFEDNDRRIIQAVREGKSHGYMQGLERALKCRSIEEVRELYLRELQKHEWYPDLTITRR